jgi:hypothetical protein
MRVAYVAAAVALFGAATGRAQDQAAQSARWMKASVDQISANIANVTEPTEKERWQANVQMWSRMVAHLGSTTKVDIDQMTADLNAIKANVARITDADERERWQANVDLWQAVLALKEKALRDDVDKIDALRIAMHANVRKLPVSAEKERWTANQLLWQSMVEQIPKG